MKLRKRTVAVTARPLDEPEVARWWPSFVEAWPAFEDHYAATGERTVFVLEEEE